MRQAVTLAARVTQRTRLLGTAWGRWRKVTANMVLESHLHEVRQEHDARVGSETKARWRRILLRNLNCRLRPEPISY